MYWLTHTFPVEIVQVLQLSLLSLRPGRSRDFEIGSYRHFVTVSVSVDYF